MRDGGVAFRGRERGLGKEVCEQLAVSGLIPAAGQSTQCQVTFFSTSGWREAATGQEAAAA